VPGECLATPKVEDAADYDVAFARFPITNSFGNRAPARATLGRLATSMPMAAGREPPSRRLAGTAIPNDRRCPGRSGGALVGVVAGSNMVL